MVGGGGSLLTKNRQYPFKTEISGQDCHCEQCGCTLKNGPVPLAECTINCINVSTGRRYGSDEHGNYLCPICGCVYRLLWDVSRHCALCHWSQLVSYPLLKFYFYIEVYGTYTL